MCLLTIYLSDELKLLRVSRLWSPFHCRPKSTDLIADIEIVTASARELSAHDVAPSEFPQYTADPMFVDTQKLANLGWESTPRTDAVAAHAEDYLDSDRDGTAHGPDREAERRAIEALTE